MIVKCQRALFPSNGPVLIYSKNRKFEVQIDLDNLWERLFKKHGLDDWMKAKFFAEVHVEGESLIVDEIYEDDLGW